MDKKRAKEICSSPVMVDVTYNGMPIYIANVSNNSGLATIHPVNQPYNNQEVPVTSLIEH